VNVSLERRCHRGPERGVGYVADDPAVERAHRVRVLRTGIQRELGSTDLD
jgi:hypothetical protein